MSRVGSIGLSNEKRATKGCLGGLVGDEIVPV